MSLRKLPPFQVARCIRPLLLFQLSRNIELVQLVQGQIQELMFILPMHVLLFELLRI